MKRLLHTLAGMALLSSTIAFAMEESQYGDEMLLLYQDEEMISIATGTQKPIHLAPSVASVITSDDIKKMGATTIAEALEFVPGIHISKSINRQSHLISIRGIHTQFNPQVLFMINGIAVKDLQTNAIPATFELPIANVSRIEIIRGPGSAVYGADAFSGAINVITKSPAELDGLTTGYRGGSFNTHDVWLQAANNINGWDSAFSFEYYKTDGDDSRVINEDMFTVLGIPGSLAPAPLNSSAEIYNTSVTLNKDNWNIWLNSWNQKEAGVRAGVSPALDTVGHQHSYNNNLAIDYAKKELFPHLDIDTKLVYSRYHIDVFYRLFPPGAVFPIGPDGNLTSPGLSDPSCPDDPNFPGIQPSCYVTFSDGVIGHPGGTMDTYSYELASTFHHFEDHTIRLAVGFEHYETRQFESKNFGPGVIDGTDNTIHGTIIDGTLTDVTGTSAIYLENRSRQLAYLSFQDEWHIAPDWELTGGVRYDDYSDFGETINPRLALVWATDYNMTTKFLYGRAFRAPSFNELYNQNNPAAIGNPDVDPETIDMLELAIDYRPNFDLHTNFNIYRYDIDGLIEFVGGTAQNNNDVAGYGLETDIQWKASDRLKLLANAAWQKSKYKATDEAVPDAPGYQVSVALRYKLQESCWANTQANWVAGRERAKQSSSPTTGISNDPRENIDDYTTVDASLRCQAVKASMEVAFGVKNIFNTDANEPSPYNPDILSANMPSDYPLNERSIFVELSYHLD